MQAKEPGAMRAPTRPAADVPPHRYTDLIAAIVSRAWRDAQGDCDCPGHRPPEKLQAEARAWLADEAAVASLVELAGCDSAPVLRRLGALRETGR